ncbi:hypothetical protein [Glycomyces buryatensis]|uniref:Uncharacterized protein n=1 Tax=Glycomyces buryatensis TaxID=2570927 RepID=A0A4S8QC65_9ACTN|nr:hypothetical protein [Glycomyces buryatensis]THV41171.1 hypothetical protein FAB82_13045 [Glycomyces buryatensis]
MIENRSENRSEPPAPLRKREHVLPPLRLQLLSVDTDLRFDSEITITIRRPRRVRLEQARAMAYGHVQALADKASSGFPLDRPDAARIAVEAAVARRTGVVRGLLVRSITATIHSDGDGLRKTADHVALRAARDLAGSTAVAEVIRAELFHRQVFSDPGRLASHLLLARPDIGTRRVAEEVVELIRAVEGMRPDAPSIRIAEVLYEFVRDRPDGEKHDLLEAVAAIAIGFDGGTAAKLRKLAEQFASPPERMQQSW